MKLKSSLLTVAARGLLAASCLSALYPTLAQEPKSASAVAPVSAKKEVEIRDFMFKPETLTVPAGTQVTFINRDDEPHTVASRDGKFVKSKPLDTDQAFSVTLTAPGEYAYFCTVHPHMTGKITVTAP